jgi:DNA-binding NarL/FixJ family response regulator
MGITFRLTKKISVMSNDNNENINLALVDEHKVYRQVFSSFLSQFHDITVTIETANGCDLLHWLTKKPCNVVLLDLHRSVLNGIQIIKAVKEGYPDIKILVLSLDADLGVASNLLDVGIHGYLSKSDTPEELYEAIRAVHQNRVYRNKLLTEALYFAKYNDVRNLGRFNKKVNFDDREIHILKLLWEEKGNKEIASEISLGIRSVEKIRQDMKKKLGVSTTVGLLKYALKNKLILVDDELAHTEMD